MKVVIEKEKGVFTIKAEGIQTPSDVQEVIHQLKLVEGQICNVEKEKIRCAIFSREGASKGTFTVQAKKQD